MLLQRASAGSGKTFKLAKTYIRLFISAKEEDNDYYRLLSAREVRDAHSHILGVTFTNKATNEMKQRIVEKLAALSHTVPARGMEPSGYKLPDYLADFTGENANADPIEDIIYTAKGIPATREEITQTCRAALKVLLNDYGNFNISTIDSFFQGVLRTLAYELHLNDTYHVELNDDYLAQVGVDETLGSVKDVERAVGMKADMSRYMSQWLRIVMMRRLRMGEAWDAFSKRGNKGIYAELMALAGKMSREDFKRNLAEMGDYFESPQRFMNFYQGMLRLSGQVGELHREAVKAVRTFTANTIPAGYNSGIAAGLASILETPEFGTPKTGVKFDQNRSSYPSEVSARNHPFRKDSPDRDNSQSCALFTNVCDSLYRWQEVRDYWSTLLSRLHYMGALYFINLCIDEFREENNVIPLSATNDILHQIISGDETDGFGEVPFIYERTGVRLHHFLLDEFQDTSNMQWNNLRPLLAESDAYGHENLIIGDAKQSIYRFRNADPALISGGVEQAFPRTRVLPDESAKGTPAYDVVNTNWRSSRHVVSFNNSLFQSLATVLDKETPGFFSWLYGNVVQHIRHTEIPGYVDIDFSSKEGYSTLGTLIDGLRERGYKLSDIAILVDTRGDGKKAIDAIISHNRTQQSAHSDYHAIEFISEESLLVSESTAVKVILAVMGLIANDFILPENKEENERTPKSEKVRHYELERLVANFNIGLSRGDVKSIADAVETEAIITYSEIEALYRTLGAVTLPSLVEGIASKFLTEEMQTTQIAYISAFQDAVLQYCDTYPADISSFLSWWQENGGRLSIAAPEGIDAVQVMTIHKSKGLEFDIVIIPKADWPLDPTKEHMEIIWVSHIPDGLSESEIADAPKKIPVTPNGKVMSTPDSPFFEAYNTFRLECRTDQLNKTYVAFTRAVKELYITAPVSKEESKQGAQPSKIGGYMLRALEHVLSTDTGTNPNLLTAEQAEFNSLHFHYGTPTIKKSSQATDSQTDNILIIDRYSPRTPITGAHTHFSLSTPDA